MNKTTSITNVVDKQTLNKIQNEVLQKLSGILSNSFGPMGSNTCIKKENAFNIYTKDGHTILKNIYFHGIIEQSIKDDVETITRHIVKTVGDGTTSAVMLAAEMYESIMDISSNYDIPPVEMLNHFKKVIHTVCEDIKAAGHEATLEDIYDICMISTNGNDFISKTISDIYSEYGMEVFIDVSASTDTDTIVKSYDGMTLNTGFANPCYVNNNKNEAVIDNPRIYFFQHPIDTKEMAVLFDTIITKNIIQPYSAMVNSNPGNKTVGSMIPTVIITPKLSQDLSAIMSSVVNLMAQQEKATKLPLLIIEGYHQTDEVADICLLCNGKGIHKYIDPDILKHDIETGEAPTPDTIQDFCGFCDQVVATNSKTSFINPADMHTENGEFTMVYKNLLDYLETGLKNAKENGEDARVIGGFKRRIHALRSNLVELIIGGISQSDRDALRDLVEDAVLNCRSAAANGVGYGANFMALKALDKYDAIHDASDIESEIADSLYDGYSYIISALYENCSYWKDLTSTDITKDLLISGCPWNIRTGEFDGKVKSSIESDIVILNTVSEIIGLMATCNQFIVPSPMHNVYVD